MNTDDDIQVHELEIIEARLCTEPASTHELHEGDAATASGFMVGSASGFMVG